MNQSDIWTCWHTPKGHTVSKISPFSSTAHRFFTQDSFNHLIFSVDVSVWFRAVNMYCTLNKNVNNISFDFSQWWLCCCVLYVSTWPECIFVLLSVNSLFASLFHLSLGVNGPQRWILRFVTGCVCTCTQMPTFRKSCCVKCLAGVEFLISFSSLVPSKFLSFSVEINSAHLL